MTGEQFAIEALGDHDYLVRVPVGEDLVTVRIRANPEIVTCIAGDGADEVRVVGATMTYLTARQRADDLPEQLDLEDVVAAYDNYVADLREQMVGQ